MNDSELVDEARRWLRFATEDLDVAQRLLAADGIPPRHACSLAQQAAEKALKAALVLEGIDFPFRHDLDALRNLLPDTWSVRRTHTDLAQLTEWAVETRYPGDWQEATATDAEQAVSQARGVYNSIAAEFERRTNTVMNLAHRVIRFDESVVPRTSPEHLDEELTRRFLREDAELTEDTLHKLRIVAADEEDVVRLTLAGVLLCTREPQQWMPHAYIQAVSYAGERTDVNSQTDARDIEGPLDVAGCGSIALCAAEHAGASDQSNGPGRSAAVQRAGRV